MKLEDLYLYLQERYLVEQEKQRLAEQRFKEEVKMDIQAIVNCAQGIIKENKNELYNAYEKIRKDIEHNSSEETHKGVYVLFKFQNEGIRPFLYMNEFYRTSIGYFSLGTNLEIHLNNLLSEYGSGTYLKIEFEDEVMFNLSDSCISLKVTAKRKANGSFDNGELNIIRKFISDVKEMFPNAEDIVEPDESIHICNLTITFNCFGNDISDVFKCKNY